MSLEASDRSAGSPPPLPVVLEPEALRPHRTAALLAASYVALCVGYIFVSSRLAAALARDQQELERFETWKGSGFVVVTGVAFYFAAATWLRRIAAQRKRLAEQQARLLAADRRALAGEIAAAIAHDINNALVVAKAHAGDLGDASLPEGERRAATVGLQGAVQHVGALARRLAQIGRGGMPDRQLPLDLAAVANESLALIRSHATVRACDVTTAISGPIAILGHATGLQRMLLNLVLNAAEALEGRGRIEVRARVAGSLALIEVHDAGPGIPASVRDRLFEPCFTTKAAGSGLGLLSVQTVATEHGGTVEVDASPLGGACFRVLLPLRAGAGATPARPCHPSPTGP